MRKKVSQKKSDSQPECSSDISRWQSAGMTCCAFRVRSASGATIVSTHVASSCEDDESGRENSFPLQRKPWVWQKTKEKQKAQRHTKRESVLKAGREGRVIRSGQTKRVKSKEHEHLTVSAAFFLSLSVPPLDLTDLVIITLIAIAQKEIGMFFPEIVFLHHHHSVPSGAFIHHRLLLAFLLSSSRWQRGWWRGRWWRGRGCFVFHF